MIGKINGSSQLANVQKIKMTTKNAIRVRILSINVPRFSKVYHIHSMRIKLRIRFQCLVYIEFVSFRL